MIGFGLISLSFKGERRSPIIFEKYSYCTRLCEVETNIKLIQELMGQADIKTTMQIYAEVTQQAKADADVRLSGNLGIAI